MPEQRSRALWTRVLLWIELTITTALQLSLLQYRPCLRGHLARGLAQLGYASLQATAEMTVGAMGHPPQHATPACACLAFSISQSGNSVYATCNHVSVLDTVCGTPYRSMATQVAQEEGTYLQAARGRRASRPGRELARLNLPCLVYVVFLLKCLR